MATTNAYAELVATANSLVGVDQMEAHRWDDEWSEAFLSSVVVPNESVFDHALDLMSQTCRVSFEFSTEWQKSHWDDVMSFRQLLVALKFRSLNRSNNGDLDAAVSSAVAILRLALVCRNGGIITDLLMGCACEGVGVDLLRRLRHQFDTDKCLALVSTLEELVGQRESFDTILARDQEWDRHLPEEEPSDVKLTFDDTIAEMSRGEELADSEVAELREFARMVEEYMQIQLAAPPEARQHTFRQSDRQDLTIRRLLIAELALRAFWLRTGIYPDDLPALVTEYLPSVPLDPFSGEPLCYRRTEDGYLLYSVGDSGEDYGGMFGSRLDVQCCGADLCLDHEDLSEDHFERLCREAQPPSLVVRLRAAATGLVARASRPFSAGPRREDQ